MRGRICLCVSVLMLAATTACGGGSPAVHATAAPVRVGAFDFAESRLLAEIYAGALGRAGVPATVVPGIGAREVVLPALQQGLIDVVPEYAGTAVRFFGGLLPAVQNRSSVQVSLQSALAGTDLEALRPARARDSNGVAVLADGADRRGWERISDLATAAGRLTFGGPPECADRPLCLRGLENIYGLHFREFITLPTFATTAAALRSGEIDVGLLNTTDPALLRTDIRLLADDRGLQPPDYVVPVLHAALAAAHGGLVRRALNSLAEKLTTDELIACNAAVERGADPRAVARDWLAAHP